MAYTGFENLTDDELCLNARAADYGNNYIAELVKRVRKLQGDRDEETDDLRAKVLQLENRVEALEEDLTDAEDEVQALLRDKEEIEEQLITLKGASNG